MLHLADPALPHIHGGDARAHRFGIARQNLERIGHLQRRDDGRDGIQYAGRFAGGLGAARWLGIHAAKTSGAPRNHRHGQAVAAHGGAIDPGDAAAQREIVQQVAGLEVVRAVEDQCGVVQQFGDVGRGDVRHNRAHGDGGINARQTAPGRHGLGQRFSGIGFFKQPLPLQIARLHIIPVDDGQAPPPGSCPGRRSRRWPHARATTAPGRLPLRGGTEFGANSARFRWRSSQNRW